jgi:drug/metabolite transporter (DMT)-like permease
MNKNIKIIFLILVILFGIFMFVYGEYDDSPGGQLLGLIVVIVGAFGLLKNIKAKNK